MLYFDKGVLRVGSGATEPEGRDNDCLRLKGEGDSQSAYAALRSVGWRW